MTKCKWMQIGIASLTFFIVKEGITYIRFGQVDIQQALISTLVYGVVFGIITFFRPEKKKSNQDPEEN